MTRSMAVVARFAAVIAALALFSACDESDRDLIADYTESVVHSPQLSVHSGEWHAFDFVVTSDMVDPFLRLDFDVTSGRDAEVFVFHESGYASWPTGPNAEAIYFSGRVGSVSHDIRLTRTGRYYLVVSNRFSVVTDKVMELDADLAYQL
ncbi:hypothetical protein FJZ36_16285 [Candidatus Poribacteria bacterium]|nr:hypothetical protein [Candidatus Poribacteria bacterium]